MQRTVFLVLNMIHFKSIYKFTVRVDMGFLVHDLFWKSPIQVPTEADVTELCHYAGLVATIYLTQNDMNKA